MCATVSGDKHLLQALYTVRFFAQKVENQPPGVRKCPHARRPQPDVVARVQVNTRVNADALGVDNARREASMRVGPTPRTWSSSNSSPTRPSRLNDSTRAKSGSPSGLPATSTNSPSAGGVYETRHLDYHALASCKLYTPFICQPLNVRIACSLTLCVRRVRRVPLRWPAPGTCLTCLDRARRRPARMWCVPVLPSPPARAYTMVWLGAVSSLKLRGAGGVCAGLPCSRRP